MENYNTQNPPADNGKTAAIVGYITLIGWLIAYFAMYKDNKTSLAGYHLRQSLLLMLTGIALGILNAVLMFVPGVYYVIMCLQLVLFVFWILGLIAAINEQEKPIPVIGSMAQSMFSGI